MNANLHPYKGIFLKSLPGPSQASLSSWGVEVRVSFKRDTWTAHYLVSKKQAL